jgi:hypothetical protein
MIHTDEDDEFDRILRENRMKGQPYHFEKRGWVNLTNAEIGEIYRAGWANNMDYAEAIQKALREKNSA